MIPILFSKTETDFTTNGLGRLSDCISCKVTEERNGVYECEFEYPIDGVFYQEIHDNGGIIGVIHDDKHDIQPFDIYGFEAPINGIVTFYAHHISYRLNNIIVTAFNASSVAEVMVKLSTESANTNPFTFWTDKQTAANFSLNHPESIRALLGGSEGSILDIYGGEYEFDKLTLKLHSDRGNDSGVTIRYGKNMTDISHEKDESETYNAIAPYWIGTDDQQQEVVVTLPETYIMATGHTETARPMAVDMSAEFDDEPTEAQLRAKAQTFIDNNTPWIPHENVKVDFVQLWQTPEYENVASLLRVSLCDYVSIYYPELGVVQERQKVIRVVYDVLMERFEEMEIGEAESSLSQTIIKTASKETAKQIQEFGSVMQEAIETATEWITGGVGGYVIFKKNADGQPEEILIMDKADINTAVKIIRMNKNGIGFSTNGYAGPYETAWTINGDFSADFITSGTFNANLIKAGTLSDYAGKNVWNMLTGQLSIESGDITLKGESSSASLGTVTIQYIDSEDYRDVKLSTASRVGLEVKSDDNKNRLALIANYGNSAPRYGSIIYSEASEALLEDFVHKRVYKTNLYNNRSYICQEDIGFEWNWWFYNLSSNLEPMLMSLSEYGWYVATLVEDSTSHTKYSELLASIERSRFIWLEGRASGGNRCGIKVENGEFRAGVLYDSSGHEIGTGPIIIVGGNNGFSFFWNNGQSYFYPSGAELMYCGKRVEFQSTSSKRFKKDISKLSDKRLDPYKLLDLPVIQYKYKKGASLQYEDMADQLLPGFIAEDVEELYPSAAVHDPEGKILTWDERRIIPGMLKLIQDQQKTIEDLKDRLEKLEKYVMGDK